MHKTQGPWGKKHLLIKFFVLFLKYIYLILRLFRSLKQDKNIDYKENDLCSDFPNLVYIQGEGINLSCCTHWHCCCMCGSRERNPVRSVGIHMKFMDSPH